MHLPQRMHFPETNSVECCCSAKIDTPTQFSSHTVLKAFMMEWVGHWEYTNGWARTREEKRETITELGRGGNRGADGWVAGCFITSKVISSRLKSFPINWWIGTLSNGKTSQSPNAFCNCTAYYWFLVFPQMTNSTSNKEIAAGDKIPDNQCN